ncbi:MAG: 3-oxoacyl-[acyl-carrier-protein] synthase III C-terminal domain-containing protein [Hyphomonadaceae bacterium]
MGWRASSACLWIKSSPPSPSTATHRPPLCRWRSTPRSDGRIKSGDLVLMEALGGGLTWGAALVRGVNAPQCST